jgi:peptidoglycan hydrolase CwlO-like protein
MADLATIEMKLDDILKKVNDLLENMEKHEEKFRQLEQSTKG